MLGSKHVLVSLVVVANAYGCTAATDAPHDSPVKSQRSALSVGAEPTHEHGLPPIRQGAYPAGKGTPQHGGGVTSGTWSAISTTPNIAAGFSILLTDGSAMVQDLTNGGGDWWRLAPDANGSYATGVWTQLPSMPNGYAPLYFASGVLPDGRVIFIGGEYQAFVASWQTQGAIFDPATNQWTPVAPPAGWQNIGDAQSAVLADGRYLIASCCSTQMAVLDPATLTWTEIASTGKADIFDEEGWTLLPNGKLLTVDSNNANNLTNSELFTPPDAKHVAGWASAGSTINQIADFNADGTGSWEVGPAMLRYDGTVFQSGATGHTSIYDVRKGLWHAGPDYPVIAGEGQLDQADGGAVLLPNGNVLVAASWGVFNGPAHFLEFDGKNLTEVAAPASAAFDSSYNINFLLLPSGEVLETDFSGDVELYQAANPRPVEAARPEIDECGLMHTLKAGSSYPLSGNQLHGLSAGVSYGDDAQAATNYPIVRIKNLASGHVTFARTHGFSNFSIARHAQSDATFDVPAGAEKGKSELVVIANGIASDAVRVNIK